MFYNDHNPPHFHVIYQEDEAIIDIKTLEILEGYLPKRATALVVEWGNRTQRRTDKQLAKSQKS